MINYHCSNSSISCMPIPVEDLIKSWGFNPICSCVLGISKKYMELNINNNLYHSALLLLPIVIDYTQNNDEEIKNESGIIIEYGDFNPNMTETEKKYTEKRYVNYRYGDKGGLRYYKNNYDEFIKEFGDIGFIDLNIDVIYQQTFDYFINKIAPLEDNKWIKANYSINNFNSHNFVIEVLKEIKPYFYLNNIYPTNPDLAEKESKRKLDFIPSDIKNELKNFYKI